MLSKAAKNEIIEQFSEVFKAKPSVLLIEYKGLSVKELEGLRSNLRGADTNLTVVKNTLLRKAAKDTDIEQLSELLIGPTAIAVCENDPTAAAKVFVDTAKDIPSLVIKGGVVEGTVVGVEEITALSKLPSRQEMMAQLLGALTSPMSNLLGTLDQLQTKLLYALEAVKDTKTEAPEAKEEPKEEAKAEEAKEEETKVETEAKEESPDENKPEEKAEAEEEVKEEVKEEPEEPKEEAKAESEPEASEEEKAEAEEESKAEAADEAQSETVEEAQAEEAAEEDSADSEEESEEEAKEDNEEEEKDKK